MKELKPFIKWAGGKTQLLPVIEKHLPLFIKNGNPFNYVEPFVGSGAVLFYLLENFSNNIKNIVINDFNTRLIFTYQSIQKKPNEISDKLNEINSAYNKIKDEEKKHFFNNVKKEFNSLERIPINALDIGSRFIFLNKTGFNGMYRENKKGEYNIPFGNQLKPSIPNKETILKISEAIKNVEIKNLSYEKVLIRDSKIKTLYYLDPPYIPLNKTSSFNQYISSDKCEFDSLQSLENIRLHCESLIKNNGAVMLSNVEIPETKKEFSSIGKIHVVPARRSINANGKKRGAINEIIVVSNE